MIGKPVLVSVPKDGTAPDVLAERYRTACDKRKGGREQWIEGTLELAAVVAQARKKYPAHQEYGRWIERNSLQQVGEGDRLALAKIGGLKDAAARHLLEQSSSWSVDLIWRNRPQAALRRIPEGRLGTIQRDRKRASGSQKRNRIPDVMRDDLPEPPPPPKQDKPLSNYLLTREQVDPDFKGTAVQFATKYGHVLLHTKDEIEQRKRKEALIAWVGAVSDHEKTARAMLTALAAVDPDSITEWMGKPMKAEKMRAWCNNIRLACESVVKFTC